MTTLPILVLGAIKALLLLTVATCLTLAMRTRPARLRAVVWGTALAGTLLIPIAAPLLPSWSVPLPAALASLQPQPPPKTDTVVGFRHLPSGHTATPNPSDFHSTAARVVESSAGMSWQMWLIGVWIIGAALALSHLGIGLWRMARAVRRAGPVTDCDWTSLLVQLKRLVGCRRPIRLLVSNDVDVPVTVGVLRPVVVLPRHARGWPRDRRWAVLMHELVHVARLDWLTRIIARVARSAYWFNPLAWWAARRLELELELACDEEVLAFGTRASNYANHLLGIARPFVRRPAVQFSGVEMARRSHLEERIMTMLKRRTHRRVGMSVLVPAAVLVAAMVPAIAAVHPGSSEPRPASPAVKSVVTEMREAEARLEPHLKRIEQLELELEPQLEAIEDIEVDIERHAIADVELKMQPHIERIEQIELDMEPLTAQIEELEKKLHDIEFHIEDGTLDDIQRQIHEQMEPITEQIEAIHVDMEPFHEQMEAIHLEMEPLRKELEKIHVDMEPLHREMERLHESMEPFHEQMEAFHLEMEPLHEELERLGLRLDRAIRGDVAAFLRDRLGPVTSPGAPFDEAAARIVEEAEVRVTDGTVQVSASRGEARQILSDLMAPHRVGAQGAFDDTIKDTADALSPLVISID